MRVTLTNRICVRQPSLRCIDKSLSKSDKINLLNKIINYLSHLTHYESSLILSINALEGPATIIFLRELLNDLIIHRNLRRRLLSIRTNKHHQYSNRIEILISRKFIHTATFTKNFLFMHGLKADIQLFLEKIQDKYKFNFGDDKIEFLVERISRNLAVAMPQLSSDENPADRPLWKDRATNPQWKHVGVIPPQFIARHYKDIISENDGSIPQTIVRHTDRALFTTMDRWVEKNPTVDLKEVFGFRYPKRTEVTEEKYLERFGKGAVEALNLSRQLSRESMRDRKNSEKGR